MKYDTAVYLLAFFGSVTARPSAAGRRSVMSKREVPQEHSHEESLISCNKFLKLDNPDNIQDCVFGLLGNAAASTGAGNIKNPDCLHKATADRAFTNAKKAGDVGGLTGALTYAALERNTGKVGLASVICTEKAVNPEIEALTQHQDPASDNAAAVNKAITLELARQLAAAGADPLLALRSGTFAPGDKNDPTGAGNTCDTLNDPVGCIFTLNRLVEDATAEEVKAAVAGGAGAGAGAGNGAGAGAGAGAGNGAGNGAVDACPAASTVTVDPPAATAAPAAGGDAASACPATVSTVTVDPPAAATAAPVAGGDTASACTPVTSTVTVDPAAPAAPAATAPSTPTTGGTNVQTFTGTKGGPPPPVISSAGARPFSVNGNTFVNAGAALQRSCAIQNNACANAVNSKAIEGSVSDCNAQEQQCRAATA